MLCAATLAALDALAPTEKRPLPPPSDCVSEDLAPPSVASTSPTARRAATVVSSSSIGRPVDASAHAAGTTAAYDSVEKWVCAAIASLGREPAHLLTAAHEPDDKLASDVHGVIAAWIVNKTTAREAGVVDARDYMMNRPPPQEAAIKARGWMLRYINAARATRGMRELSSEWGRTLANRRADSRAINTSTREKKAASGALYHHKHDFAPSNEEIEAMTHAGFVGDKRVHGNELDALEAGMAIALYMATGARGSELKKMHLQSLGHETIQDERSGTAFECLKLTAFETKTKDRHLNQLLAHAHPWRDGVGLFGLSLLVRVQHHGPPPFSMHTDENSWKVVGTSTRTLDDRLKAAFNVAGVRRQTSDPVTYLGRHLGTRKLQHAGGSAEGGAARTGHSGSARDHYTECPLPDLLRLAGNDPDTPFVPAHQQPELRAHADAVLAHLFPDLAKEERAVEERQSAVDRMGRKSDRARTDERLNDRERMLRAMRFAARTALCCLAARPRSWRRWEIVEDGNSMMQCAMWHEYRIVRLLFGGNHTATAAMAALAGHVRRCEDAEIAGRRAAPDKAVECLFSSAVQAIVSAVNTAPATVAAAPPPQGVPAEAGAARVKHKRVAQTDVAYFSSFANVGDALAYARDELAPLEREQGAAWRVRKIDGGAREDKSRDKQWRSYRALAIAVGSLEDRGDAHEAAVAAVQARLDGGSHTQLLRALLGEQKAVGGADELAARVLGF